MSSGIDIKYVQERYEQMPDDELVYMVTNNAGGLTPEALEVAKREVKKRGMNLRLLDALDVQNKTLTERELNDYCELVRDLNCPICGSTEKLNATLKAEVMSYVFGSHYEKKIQVGCPKCLVDLNRSALFKTLIFGWWDIPSGIINSVQAIAVNRKSMRLIQMGNEPNKYLETFVLAKLVQLELHKGDQRKLNAIISEVLEENKSNMFGIGIQDY